MEVQETLPASHAKLCFGGVGRVGDRELFSGQVRPGLHCAPGFSMPLEADHSGFVLVQLALGDALVDRGHRDLLAQHRIYRITKATQHLIAGGHRGFVLVQSALG